MPTAPESAVTTDPSLGLWVSGRRVATVEVAADRRARRRGLLGRDRIDGAFVLEPCRAVHTFGMRMAIDVAHIRRDGTVLRVRTIRPRRLDRPVLRAASVLESEAGSCAAWGVHPGARVAVR